MLQDHIASFHSRIEETFQVLYFFNLDKIKLKVLHQKYGSFSLNLAIYDFFFY